MYLRNFVRNKADPLVTKVKVLHIVSNKVAYILSPTGRESSVSTADLAPIGEATTGSECNSEAPMIYDVHTPKMPIPQAMIPDITPVTPDKPVDEAHNGSNIEPDHVDGLYDIHVEPQSPTDTEVAADTQEYSRRSSRNRRPPVHFRDYILDD